MSIKLKRHGGDYIYVDNHEKLANRDKEDQHPIKAITGLNEVLEEYNNTLNELKNNTSEWEEFIF